MIIIMKKDYQEPVYKPFEFRTSTSKEQILQYKLFTAFLQLV